MREDVTRGKSRRAETERLAFYRSYCTYIYGLYAKLLRTNIQFPSRLHFSRSKESRYCQRKTVPYLLSTPWHDLATADAYPTYANAIVRQDVYSEMKVASQNRSPFSEISGP